MNVVAVQDSGEIRVVAPERAVEWVKTGWRLFRAMPAIWALIGLALLVLNVVLGIMPPMIGSAAAAILMPIVGGGLMAACDAQERGETIRFDYVHLGFRENTTPLATTGGLILAGVGASVMITLIIGSVGAWLGTQLSSTGIGTVVALGSLLMAGLLLLGLLIGVSMAAWFAPALVMLSLRAPKDALRASFVASLKNWLPLMIYGILLWLMLALCILTAGLGLLVLIPVTAGSMYQSYRDIFA